MEAITEHDEHARTCFTCIETRRIRELLHSFSAELNGLRWQFYVNPNRADHLLEGTLGYPVYHPPVPAGNASLSLQTGEFCNTPDLHRRWLRTIPRIYRPLSGNNRFFPPLCPAFYLECRKQYRKMTDKGGLPIKKASLSRFLLLFSLVQIFNNTAHPITPTVINRLDMPDYMFGVCYAIMSAAYFLFAPLWGKISDRVGRAKTIAFVTVGNSLGQLIFGLATGPVSLVIGRTITGMFAGGYHVSAMAYVADISTSENLGKNTSIYAAIISVSTAGGYLLGGLLGDLGIGVTFGAQCIGLIAAGALIFLFLDNAQQYDRQTPISLKTANPFSAFAASKPMWSTGIVLLFIGVFAASFATNGYDNAFNYYIKDILNFPPSYNGIIKALVGLIGLTANFTINLWLVKRTDNYKSIIGVFSLCASSLFCVVLTGGNLSFIVFNIVFYIFNAIYLPIQQAIVANSTDKVTNGVKLGMFNSIRALGMVFGPLTAGFAYAVWSKLPFVLCAVSFAIAVVSSVLLLFYRKKHCADPARQKLS